MIERIPFGATGHPSTRTLFGAAALGALRQDKADAVLELLLESGVNDIDTAASYGDSELRIAPWMADHRDRFFLATKTSERAHDGAKASIERSLERLGVDRLDMIQFHNLTDEAGWQTAMGSGGALSAAIEAREQGLVRFIGVTGPCRRSSPWRGAAGASTTTAGASRGTSRSGIPTRCATPCTGCCHVPTPS